MGKLSMEVLVSWMKVKDAIVDGQSIEEVVKRSYDQITEAVAVMGVMVQTNDGLYFVKIIPTGDFEVYPVQRRDWTVPSDDQLGTIYLGG